MISSFAVGKANVHLSKRFGRQNCLTIEVFSEFSRYLVLHECGYSF